MQCESVKSEAKIPNLPTKCLGFDYWPNLVRSPIKVGLFPRKKHEFLHPSTFNHGTTNLGHARGRPASVDAGAAAPRPKPKPAPVGWG